MDIPWGRTSSRARQAAAEDLWKEMLQISQSMYGAELRLDIKSGLALTYYYLGNYKQAESLYKEILEADRNKGNNASLPLHLLCCCKCDLARVYAAQGLYNKAERLLSETLETADWEAESRWSLRYKKALGDIYRDQGRYEDANALRVDIRKKAQSILGDEHIGTVQIMYSLAQLRTDQGDYEEANDLFSQVLEIGRRRLGDNHPAMLEFVNDAAVLRTKQKQYDDAEKLFVKTLDGRQHVLDEDHPDTLESENDLAVLYKELEKYVDAEKLLLKAVEGRRHKLGDEHPHTVESLNNLIALYEARGKPEKAAQSRAELPLEQIKEK